MPKTKLILIPRPKPRDANTALTQEERAERRRSIAEFIAKGGSPVVVARKNNVTVQYVRVCCKEYGIDPPSILKMPTGSLQMYKVLASLLYGNLTFQEIADANGTDEESVLKIYENCVQAGIKFTTRGRGKTKVSPTNEGKKK